MALSDRASALAPYAEQVLNNRDVQDAIQRAANAGRDSYMRARGTSPGKAVKDKRLQRRLQETAQASWDVWTAVSESGKPRRRARWGRRIVVVTVVGAGAFVALNTDVRQTVLGLLPIGDANSSHSPQ
jgi:hypothetical protein